MPGRRSPRLGGTLILAVLALAAAGGSLRCRPANREIIVGSILSLSGEGEYYGKHIQQGMNLAVEELNRRGGIQGRPLRVVYRDSRSRPEAGRIHAEDLYRNLRIPAIIGAVLSSVTLAIAPIAESERRILLSPASSSPKITQAGSFIFRNYPSDVLEGAYMAEFASRELHLQRIAILSVDNEYGKGLREIFRSRTEATGREVILDLEFPQEESGYPSLVSRIKEIDPDGVYLIGYYREVARFLKIYRREGIDATILGVAGFHSGELLRLAGEAAEGVIFPYLSFDSESEDLVVRRFIRDFHEEYGNAPDDWAAHGYDAVMILAQAISRAGMAAEGIRDSLREMTAFQGAAGITRFDENGDVAHYPRIFIVHGGKFVAYKDYLFQRGREENP